LGEWMKTVSNICIATLVLLGSQSAMAQIVRNSFPAIHSMTPIDFVSEKDLGRYLIESRNESNQVRFFCEALEPYFVKHVNEKNPCGNVQWKTSMQSRGGNPLIYASFGTEGPVTLVISGVHPDEYTPMPMGFRLAKHLAENPSIYEGKFRIIIAPLTNPDGFLRNIPARTNANGIDPNRNFLTMDWYENSKRFWVGQKQRRFRHFPGYFPNTEIETLFQIDLIERFRPDKIVSVHAPLGFLDYDGPAEYKKQEHNFVSKHGNKLVQQMAEKARNYRIYDFSYYPGSLGNFAGNERNILTVTLELETIDIKLVNEYWSQFLPGLMAAAAYEVKAPLLQGGGNASNFLSLYLNPASPFRWN
jgi:protein MpaA